MENSCLGLFFLLVVSQITSCESFRFLATEKAVVAVLPINGPPRCTFQPGTCSDRFHLRPLDTAPLSGDILTAKFGFELTVKEGYKTAAVVVRAAIVRNVIGKDLSVPLKSKAFSVKTGVKETATRTAERSGKLKLKSESDVEKPSSVAKAVTPSIAKGIEGATVTSKVARTSKKGAVAPATVKGAASIPAEVAINTESKEKSISKKSSAAITAGDLKQNKDKATGKPLKPVVVGLTSPAAATDKGNGKGKGLTVAAASSKPPSAKASSKKGTGTGTGTASSTALDVHPLVPKLARKKATTVTAAVTAATVAAAATLASTKGKSTLRSVPRVISASTATVLTPIKSIDKTSKSKVSSRKKSRTPRASVRAPLTGEIEGEKKVTWANAKVG